MRFVDLFNAISSGGAPAAERHYLQFDGVGDYAVADAVFGGISGDYTIAIKVASRNASGSAGFETYFASGGPGSTAANQQRHETAYGKTSTTFSGANDGGSTPTTTASGYPADSAARVIAMKRGNGYKPRIHKSSGVEYTFDGAYADNIPDHLAIGCRVDNSLSPIASRYGAVQFIGLVLASAEVPDAELTAWLNDDTAIGNITGIDHYWCASDIDGATIPARVGTVALALTGPTSSDLVAWSPS